jgi:hypothetical protein
MPKWWTAVDRRPLPRPTLLAVITGLNLGSQIPSRRGPGQPSPRGPLKCPNDHSVDPYLGAYYCADDERLVSSTGVWLVCPLGHVADTDGFYLLCRHCRRRLTPIGEWADSV